MSDGIKCACFKLKNGIEQSHEKSVGLDKLSSFLSIDCALQLRAVMIPFGCLHFTFQFPAVFITPKSFKSVGMVECSLGAIFYVFEIVVFLVFWFSDRRCFRPIFIVGTFLGEMIFEREAIS